MRDVGVFRGADIRSDHELLVAKTKVKLAKARRDVKQKGLPYNIRKLKDQATNREFVLDLKNKFQVLSETEALSTIG
jgi:tRNA A22 N-methylase